MTLDILIVAYRARDYLAKCLDSVALHTAEGFRLTVYDNRPKNYPLTWIWNRFVEQSRREFVAIVNPDVLVGPGWDTETMACLVEHPECASVNPVSNWGPHGETFPVRIPNEMVPSDILTLDATLKAASASHPRFILTENHRLACGHCFVLRRSTWADLGGFDERIPFAGNEEDFNRRAILRGMKTAICTRAFVFHYWNRSVRDAEKENELPPNTHAVRFAPPPPGNEWI